MLSLLDAHSVKIEPSSTNDSSSSMYDGKKISGPGIATVPGVGVDRYIPVPRVCRSGELSINSITSRLSRRCVNSPSDASESELWIIRWERGALIFLVAFDFTEGVEGPL
jgi:hypothetical protein